MSAGVLDDLLLVLLIGSGLIVGAAEVVGGLGIPWWIELTALVVFLIVVASMGLFGVGVSDIDL
jgi:hypothetical protein